MVFHNNLLSTLRSQMEKDAPNNWLDVKRRIARTLADELLEELSGPPSSQGLLLQIVCEEMAEPVISKLKEGA